MLASQIPFPRCRQQEISLVPGFCPRLGSPAAFSKGRTWGRSMVRWHRDHLKNPQHQIQVRDFSVTLDVPWYCWFLKRPRFSHKGFLSYLQHICPILLRGLPGGYYFITPRKLQFFKWNVPSHSLERKFFKYGKWMNKNFQMPGKAGIHNRMEGVDNFRSASNKPMHLKENKIRPWSYVNSYIIHPSTFRG